MFSYIPKSMWFPTSVDIKQAPTIEALEKLCKEGEVERVIIPMTYYGYGSTIIDDSNRRSIKRHYAANRLKDYGYALTMSSYQFLKHSEFRELVEELQEQYPIFNEQDHSNLESEVKFEHITDELFYVLNNDESQSEVDWTKESIVELLESGKWDNRIEWWEYVEIDNDGATPYSTEEQIQELAELLKVKRSNAA